MKLFHYFLVFVWSSLAGVHTLLGIGNFREDDLFWVLNVLLVAMCLAYILNSVLKLISLELKTK